MSLYFTHQPKKEKRREETKTKNIYIKKNIYQTFTLPVDFLYLFISPNSVVIKICHLDLPVKRICVDGSEWGATVVSTQPSSSGYPLGNPRFPKGPQPFRLFFQTVCFHKESTSCDTDISVPSHIFLDFSLLTDDSILCKQRNWT